MRDREFFEVEEPTQPYGEFERNLLVRRSDSRPTVDHHIHAFVLVEVLACDDCGKPAREACETCWHATCRACRTKKEDANAA
jgi:hypothetical protein